MCGRWTAPRSNFDLTKVKKKHWREPSSKNVANIRNGVVRDYDAVTFSSSLFVDTEFIPVFRSNPFLKNVSPAGTRYLEVPDG